MLYIIATPIGNLGDISYRAVETLKSVDLILCEDTRTSRSLLSHYGIKVKTQAYHDHSDETRRMKIIELLREGKEIALISDAGSPLICDPGYKLIKDCVTHGLSYTSVPGASSVVTALQLSGLPSQNFYFGGFLQTKEQARIQQLEVVMQITDSTIVFFETAKRITSTCEILTRIAPEAELVIVREITKLYEEVLSGTPQELLERLQANSIKGEIVLVIHVKENKKSDVDEIAVKIQELLPYMPVKALATYLSKECDLSKKEIYNKALELKEEE